MTKSLLGQSNDRLVDLQDLGFHEMNDFDWSQYVHRNHCCRPMDQRGMIYRMTIGFHTRPYRQGCRRACKRLRHLDLLVYENHVYIEVVPKFHPFDLFEHRLGFEFELNRNHLKIKISSILKYGPGGQSAADREPVRVWLILNFCLMNVLFVLGSGILY